MRAALSLEGLEAPWDVDGAMQGAVWHGGGSEGLGLTWQPGDRGLWDNRSAHKGAGVEDLLAHRVYQRREPQNKQSTTLLETWHKAPGIIEGLLPIEQALSQSITSLARSTPILLLVMEALSYADCRELLQALGNRG